LKSYLLVFLFFVLTFFAKAQSTKSIQLKPILKSGKHYFYDNKRLNGAYSLEIPLQSLHDEQINKYFNKFKKFQRSRGLAYLPSLAYMLYQPINTTARANAFLLILAAGILGDITLSNVGHYQMNKAIDLYNISIMQRSAIGLSLEKTTYRPMFSLGFRVKL
jgi:hypothetical protein